MVGEGVGWAGLAGSGGQAQRALGVQADHQRSVAAAQVERSGGLQLLQQQRIAEERKVGTGPGFTQQLQIAGHAALGHARARCQRAHAVRCGVARGGCRCGDGSDGLQLPVIDRAGLARAHVVIQAHDAVAGKAAPPLAHRRLRQSHALGDRGVAVAFHAAQDDPGAGRQMGGLACLGGHGFELV